MGDFELRYSTGGHGGRYHGLDTAIRAAVRLVHGNPNESWIDVYPGSEVGRWRETERVFRARRVQHEPI